MYKPKQTVLVLAMLLASAAMNAQTVSMRLNGVTVKAAIAHLEKESKCSVVYDARTVKHKQEGECQCQNRQGGSVANPRRSGCDLRN